MGAPRFRFRHQVIDAAPPGSELDITLLADIDGDGRLDIVIGGKRGEPNLFWYQNPTWQRHAIATCENLEAGGVVLDVTGNGRLDIVAGEQWNGHALYWFECPEDPRRPWSCHLITERFLKYHDQAVGDVDGDGRDELLFLSQRSGVLAYYDLPDDPHRSPWPEELCHLVADDVPDIEGLQIVDLDGDGVTEILAGPNVFRPVDGPTRPWRREPFAPDYAMTRVQVGDLDGDGRLEIVLAEAETTPARLAVCHAPNFAPRPLRDDLFHPHSLALADFAGRGVLDLFVAEMGLGKHPDPRMFLYANDGTGGLTEHLLGHGVPLHEAKVGDLTGNGLPDIVGKPYHPECHVDIWFNETDSAG